MSFEKVILVSVLWRELGVSQEDGAALVIPCSVTTNEPWCHSMHENPVLRMLDERRKW